MQMRASDSFDEDALFCDMVQYYGITDMSHYTVEAQAVLVCGLPEDSRTMRILSGRSVSTDTLLLAGILDQLRIQAWSRSKAAKNHQGRPKSIMAALVEPKKKADDIETFESGDAFMRYRESLLKGDKYGD